MDALLAQADRAFVEEEYTSAIQLYTRAIEETPSNARAWESRAHAHIKAEDYLEAANDAAKAIELDPEMSKAFFRRGVALFHLDEFEAAKTAFEQGLSLDPSGTQYSKWIRKCQAELDVESGATPASSHQAPQAGNAPTPLPASTPAPPAVTAATATSAQVQKADGSASSQNEPEAPVAPAAGPSFEGKYRHQYYQLQNKVTVDIYAKNIPRESVSCEFQETRLLVTIRDSAGGEDYLLDVELYGKIRPDQCKFEVLKPKIEVTMTKADTLQWGSLEKSNCIAAPNYSTPGTTAPAQYPSSYTKAPKNWDAVDSEISELEKKGELDDGDPLNNFFKKIFSQGDEDTRRAMMKSFVESNGTVLSTNWTDVGSKKVECTPPDGMVPKKWES